MGTEPIATPRQGPTLAIAGSCAGCAYLSWSTCKAERVDAVGDTLGKPIPWPGDTPAWCPLLPAARLALARGIVAAADDVLCLKCGKPVTTADEKSYRMHSMAGCPR